MEMKRTLPAFIALLTVFLMSACSSSTSETPQPSAQPAAPTSIPQTGNDTRVDIQLADNTITPSLTTFSVGVPYTFVITNTGKHVHNFNINPPVSEAGSLDAALNNALLAVPQDQLGPGQTATVQFTFPDSAAGNPLEFSCLIKRHYEDGMKVSITVVK
jgi:uncharacterized cupredoxin-like copper-binding protein